MYSYVKEQVEHLFTGTCQAFSDKSVGGRRSDAFQVYYLSITLLNFTKE